MDCSIPSQIVLNSGYHFLVQGAAPLAQTRFAFRCPVSSACPLQSLTTNSSTENTSALFLAGECVEGHTGVLCSSCVSGWKKFATGLCILCDSTTSGVFNPLMLLPLAFVGIYVATRKLITFRQKQKRQRLDAFRVLFRQLDLDDSGTIELHELRTNLGLLFGTEVSTSTAAEIVDRIDLDHSGDVVKRLQTCNDL